jgi:capsule polysaccharide export protein KpsE/RkpR
MMVQVFIEFGWFASMLFASNFTYLVRGTNPVVALVGGAWSKAQGCISKERNWLWLSSCSE